MNAGIHERRVIRKGATILREGETGDLAFLIQSGSVEVFTQQGGKDVVLARLKAGDIFGEMALLTDEPRAASVRAVEETSLIILERALFEQKLEKTDPTIRAIVQMLAKRITTSNKTLFGQKTDIESLIDNARLVYDSTYTQLPLSKQAVFEMDVKPKLEQFLRAIAVYGEPPQS
jgi:CRP/FNR family cyclic AMP-dependent transcriptional regulator